MFYGTFICSRLYEENFKLVAELQKELPDLKKEIEKYEADRKKDGHEGEYEIDEYGKKYPGMTMAVILKSTVEILNLELLGFNKSDRIAIGFNNSDCIERLLVKVLQYSQL